ncbi:unnamed protein product [Anisakis simplex]|uniref:Uncharacterized protein n=1 Tax=Anisakis simplex TaxID=6269 RepID=A0A0M3K9R7_ANISI|nr:unnamed protein product [Anisakis simplex]
MFGSQLLQIDLSYLLTQMANLRMVPLTETSSYRLLAREQTIRAVEVALIKAHLVLGTGSCKLNEEINSNELIVDVLDVPSSELDVLDVPSSELDVLDVPSSELDAVDGPSITLDAADVSSTALDAVDVPSTALDAVDVPSIVLDAVDVPSTALDAVDVPSTLRILL